MDTQLKTKKELSTRAKIAKWVLILLIAAMVSSVLGYFFVDRDMFDVPAVAFMPLIILALLVFASLIEDDERKARSKMTDKGR